MLFFSLDLFAESDLFALAATEEEVGRLKKLLEATGPMDKVTEALVKLREKFEGQLGDAHKAIKEAQEAKKRLQ